MLQDDDDIRHEVRRMLDNIKVADAAEDMERAVGWTVVCRDLEFGRDTLYGFFSEIPAAMEYAALLEADLHKMQGADEIGWHCTVKPILPCGMDPGPARSRL